MPTTTEALPQIPDRHFDALTRLERGYWWYIGRLEWAERLIAPWLAARSAASVLYADIGCGTGGFATSLSERLGIGRTALVDSHPAALAHLPRGRTYDVIATDISKDLALPFRPSLLTCMDVLEHIADDDALIARLASTLSPGGLLVASVPAFPSLYSDWDKHLGHHRRYTARELRRKIEKAGLVVREESYMWSFLFPAAPYRKFRPQRQTALEFPEVSAWMNQALIRMSRLEWRISRLVRPPFGTSLILAAEKP